MGGELSAYFKYPEPVRKLIYTTNPIESLHSNIKKVIRNKGSFSIETAAFKILFLSVMETEKRWTSRIRGWSEIYSQLTIFFKEVLDKYVR